MYKKVCNITEIFKNEFYLIRNISDCSFLSRIYFLFIKIFYNEG
jgi:hypothetical protein